MTHLTDRELRSLLDQEEDGNDADPNLHEHLSACADCRLQFDRLQSRANWVDTRLSSLEPGDAESTISTEAAYQRFTARTARSEKKESFLQAILGYKRVRPLFAGVVAVLLIITLLAVPSVRAVANDFLGLFRVQQIAVVEINPQNLPEQLGSSNVFEDLLSNNVTVEEFGDIQTLSDPTAAEIRAGFALRLPHQPPAGQEFRLQPGARVTFEVDLPQVEQLARELGFGDLGLPPDLDNAEVVLDVQPSLLTAYGQCQFDDIFTEGEDPSEIRFEDCLVLAQSPSPTIKAPDSINLPEIGKTFLQVMGLSPEESDEFSRTVDWTTTLVIPIPRYGSSYETVMVDGGEGTLISQEFSSHQPNFLLIWVKDGIVYSITGDGAGQEGIALANSLR